MYLVGKKKMEEGEGEEEEDVEGVDKEEGQRGGV